MPETQSEYNFHYDPETNVTFSEPNMFFVGASSGLSSGSGYFPVYPCEGGMPGVPPGFHDFAVGPTHAICNRCGEVSSLRVQSTPYPRDSRDDLLDRLADLFDEEIQDMEETLEPSPRVDWLIRLKRTVLREALKNS